MSEDRRDELAANLDDVRRRVAAAAQAAGRDPDEVTLVAVTKFFPASDVRLLADLGVTDVGENRHQEAQDKVAELRDQGRGVALRWHFIGGLQSNKAAAVAAYADVVESVDRLKLVGPLNRGAHERSREVDVLLQVSLDPPGPSGSHSGSHRGSRRSGADPDELDELAAAVEEAGMLRLRGLMAVAPLGEDPSTAYSRLAGIRDRFVATHPDATWLSAGMSSDLEAAVEAGATHVRLGTAVLGPRPLNK
jgi:pyridoxal phosphate enzyme (YggS family)